MPFLTRDADRLYYDITGTGLLLLFIHDGLLHSAAWEHQIRSFSAHYRVAWYDRRGYGQSSVPTAPYANRDDLHALIKHLDLSPVTLVGASMGGGIALDFALAYPALVDRLVLVGPALPGFGFSDHFLQRTRTRMNPLRAANDITTTITNWANDPYLVAPDNVAAHERIRQLLTNAPHNLTNPLHLLQHTPAIQSAQLATLHHPTLIVVGEYDIADNHAHAGAIQFGVPNAQRTVLRHAGHLPFLEQPEAFNAIVCTFLNPAHP